MTSTNSDARNVAFSQERFDLHDGIGCEAVKNALLFFTGELKDNNDKYGIDLIQPENKIAVEVEHCGVSRWSSGRFPPKICPPDIPLRKEEKMLKAFRSGWKYAYAWVRNDCHMILFVWLDDNRFNECSRQIRDTKYKSGEPFLLPKYEWFQYISVPQMYWRTN